MQWTYQGCGLTSVLAAERSHIPGELIMTPDMAFEGLLVSGNAEVLGNMSRVLRDLSVSTNVCLSSSKAVDMLKEGTADLVVIDWEGEASSELLQKIWQSRKRKPTIIALSLLDQPIRGAHATVQKPLTAESATKSMKHAYSRMLLDHRRNARFVVMLPVRATDEADQSIEVMVTDIGGGGIGLRADEKLTVGETLALRLLLPGATKEIHIQARVLWTAQYGAAGCEFVRMPPVDLDILQVWLKARIRVKKPLIPV
jgi:response regulator RpfG family c-di-GMP phosphodiesterase